jgi:hypothetical protein
LAAAQNDLAHDRTTVHKGVELSGTAWAGLYVASDGGMAAAAVREDASGRLIPDAPVSLFPTRVREGMSVAFRQNYVVAGDGKRFLLSLPIDEPTTAPITVLLRVPEL